MKKLLKNTILTASIATVMLSLSGCTDSIQNSLQANKFEIPKYRDYKTKTITKGESIDLKEPISFKNADEEKRYLKLLKNEIALLAQSDLENFQKGWESYEIRNGRMLNKNGWTTRFKDKTLNESRKTDGIMITKKRNNYEISFSYKADVSKKNFSYTQDFEYTLRAVVLNKSRKLVKIIPFFSFLCHSPNYKNFRCGTEDKTLFSDFLILMKNIRAKVEKINFEKDKLGVLVREDEKRKEKIKEAKYKEFLDYKEKTKNFSREDRIQGLIYRDLSEFIDEL